MMSKVILYNGSPRKKGNSSNICGILKKYFESQGVPCDYVNEVVTPCLHCKRCTPILKKGKYLYNGCAINDNYSRVLRKYDEYTDVVIVTPIYFFGVTALMKSLIDRLYSVNMQGKNLYLYLVSGSPFLSSGSTVTVQQFLMICDYLGINFKGYKSIVTDDEILSLDELDSLKLLDLVKEDIM